eukprot:11058093-Prorocentrum_lima.AAC.1
MTSSLVGSEMCIRDRPRRARLRDQVVRQFHRRHTKRLYLRSRPLKTAVSYTHLTLPTICSV